MSVTDEELAQALEELRARVRGAASEPPETLSPLQKAVAQVNAHWHVSARVPPPHPGAPLRWRLVYQVKRIVRRVMYEVLNAVIEQQNTLNANLARAVTELAKENASLRARVAALEQEAEKRKGGGAD